MISDNNGNSNLFSILNGYEDITEDGGVKKKILQKGFSGVSPSEGLEITVNFTSELEDGRQIDNTYVTREPLVFCLGSLTIVPGLDLALRKMKMGEKASVIVRPEYSYIKQEKMKMENSENSEEINGKLQEIEEKYRKLNNVSKEEIEKMDVKEAKFFTTIIYEIELVKFDKQRKHKTVMEPEERIAEAAELKTEGNELFRGKGYMEAIVKYNTGLNYLHQMPTEFLTQKVIDLRVQLTLNVTNCHICLTEYNYALKKVEEAFTMKTPPPVKCYYFRCIANMNLGEFQKAGDDYKVLRTLLPNDPLIKQLQQDFEKIKEKTINAKKGMIKKGLLNSHLYEEKVVKNEVKLLPDKVEEKSKKFYLDFIVNKNTKDPKKIKIEIFTHTVNNLPEFFKIIDQKVKDKSLNFIQVKESFMQLYEWEGDNTSDLNSTINNKLNIYPPCEPFLLVIKTNDSETFSIGIILDKISDIPVKNLIVLGRVFYNSQCLKQIDSDSEIQVTDSDYSYNLY